MSPRFSLPFFTGEYWNDFLMCWKSSGLNPIVLPTDTVTYYLVPDTFSSISFFFFSLKSWKQLETIRWVLIDFSGLWIRSRKAQ